MKHIVKIPKGDIERIQIYINSDKKSVERVRAETGADYAITCTFYNSKWVAVCHLKADGYIWADDQSYNAYGYAWDDVEDFGMALLPGSDKANYYTCCQMVREGKGFDKLYYNDDVGGARGRTAVATTAGELWLYACTDYGNALTPEELRDELAAMGARDAVMGDGGGKVNFASGEIAIIGREPSQNLLLIYLKRDREPADEPEAPPKAVKRPIVCLDPGHGGTENYNASPDGSYFEHEFTLDMGQRIREHLERCGVEVVMTREKDATVELGRRAQIANRAGADIFVSLHSNAASSTGWSDASGLCAYIYAAGGERDWLANAILGRMATETRLFGEALYYSEFIVLADTAMPAVLIEYGFHTNKADVERLKSGAWRETAAVATAKGILDHLEMAWVPEAPEPSAPDSDVIYRVQVGAFYSMENARRLAELLTAQGYDTIIKED